MIYKFKSAASGDVIMLGPQGEQMLRLLGRDAAPKGIIEPAAMPAAIAALQAAIAAEAAMAAKDAAKDEAEHEAEAGADGGRAAVALHRRLWPVIEMLRRSHAADEPVLWGV